jgi:hypothetical protein
VNKIFQCYKAQDGKGDGYGEISQVHPAALPRPVVDAVIVLSSSERSEQTTMTMKR